MASQQNRSGGGGQRRQGQQDRGGADEGTLAGVASTVKESVGDMASSVASRAEDAWDSTRQAVSSVTDTAGDAWGEMTGLMRRYPFATFLVGVGIGFALSRILEERGSADFGRWGTNLYNRAREYASDVMS